jgi:hypothetical protein
MNAQSPCPAILAVLPLACFNPPELEDDAPPPVSDLGTVDTWADLEEAGPPSAVEDDGAAAEEAGGPDPVPDLASEQPADPALGQLLITEVLADPDGTDGGADSPEFVEISNPGPLPVALDALRVNATSWPLVDGVELGLAGLVLEVDGILIIRRWRTDVDRELANVDVVDGVVWTGFLHSGALRNTDGSVALDAGTLSIDQVVYGPAEAVQASGSGLSLCRDGSDWVPCTPNPGQLEASDEGPDVPNERMPIPNGALSIVEVLANPPGASSEEKPYEFIEIINVSENPLELDGCLVGDAPDFAAPGVDPLEYLTGDGGCDTPTCLAPGARALIVGQGYLGESGSALVLTTDDTTIADGGLTNTEPVVLWNESGEIISSYRLWPDPAGEPLPSIEQPLHRIDPLADDVPASWISAPASPGI